MWLIWSQKHSMWWGPERAGYFPDLERAGRYTYQQVCEVVVADSFPPGSNIAVPERDARMWRERFMNEAGEITRRYL